MLIPQLKNGTNLKREKNGIKNTLPNSKKTGVYTARKNILTEVLEQKSFVPNTAGTCTEDIVYNLAVEEPNEYFANNILVHNCDALANACYATKRSGYTGNKFQLFFKPEVAETVLPKD